MGRKESSSLPSQCKNEPKDVWGHPAGRDGELPMYVLIPVSPQPPSLCVTRPGGGSQGSHWRGEAGQDPFSSLFPLSLPSCRDRHCCWKSSKVTAKEFAFPELGFMRPERALALGPAASPQPGEFVWTPCRKMQAEIPGRLQRGQTLTSCVQEDFVSLLGLIREVIILGGGWWCWSLPGHSRAAG